MPNWITIAGGSVWVANVGDSDSVGRYDPRTGRQTGTARIGTAPNAICASMDSGHGALWVAHCSSNDISRIDLPSGVVTDKVSLQPREIAENSSVTAGEGSVFILTAGSPATIVRIDPATNSVAASFPAPTGATSLRAGAGGLWVSTRSALTRLDPTNNSVLATIKAQDAMSEDHQDMTFGDGYLWVRVADVLVAQVDPGTNTVVARYGPTITGGGALAVDDTAMWITPPRPAEDLAPAINDHPTERFRVMTALVPE